MASNYFQLESDILKKIALTFDRSEKSLNEDVAILRSWLESQPHLPEVLDDKSILNFLFLCKCSIEKTKQKVDNYYSLRSKIPDQFENSNPNNAKMGQIIDGLYWLPIPKLTQEMYRVVIFKVRNADIVRDLYPIDVHKLLLNFQEVRLHEDVMFGDIFLFDLAGVPLDYFLRMTPTVMLKLVSVYEQVYSLRLKGLYFFNAPSIISTLLAVIKKLLKAKLFARVQVLELENLFEYVPKKILPKDYGGEEKSLEELQSLMKLKYQEYNERFELLDKMKVNEELRPKECKNDELLGFHGTFKKLDVD